MKTWDYNTITWDEIEKEVDSIINTSDGEILQQVFEQYGNYSHVPLLFRDMINMAYNKYYKKGKQDNG